MRHSVLPHLLSRGSSNLDNTSFYVFPNTSKIYYTRRQLASANRREIWIGELGPDKGPPAPAPQVDELEFVNS